MPARPVRDLWCSSVSGSLRGGCCCGIVIEEFLPQKRLKDLKKKEEGKNDMHGQQSEEKQRKQHQHMWSPSSQRCCSCSCSSSCTPGNNNTGGCSAFDKPCSKVVVVVLFSFCAHVKGTTHYCRVVLVLSEGFFSAACESLAS